MKQRSSNVSVTRDTIPNCVISWSMLLFCCLLSLSLLGGFFRGGI